jgi:hypothetical protein
MVATLITNEAAWPRPAAPRRDSAVSFVIVVTVITKESDRCHNDHHACGLMVS